MESKIFHKFNLDSFIRSAHLYWYTFGIVYSSVKNQAPNWPFTIYRSCARCQCSEHVGTPFLPFRNIQHGRKTTPNHLIMYREEKALTWQCRRFIKNISYEIESIFLNFFSVKSSFIGIDMGVFVNVHLVKKYDEDFLKQMKKWNYFVANEYFDSKEYPVFLVFVTAQLPLHSGYGRRHGGLL
jgi:hypothetical protein